MNIYVNSRLLATTDQSGITVYIKELYSRLVILNKNTKFYFIQPKGKIFFKNTITLFSLPTILGNFIFDFIYPLFIFDKNSKLNIYHATTNVLPIFKPKNTRYILSVYDLSFKVNKEIYPLIYQLYFDLMLKHSVKIADKIITISENTKSDLVKYYNVPSGKISNIYISASNDFEVVNKDSKIIPEPYVLVLAGHPTRKNLHGLLEAFSKCQSKNKLNLVIAGKIQDPNLIELDSTISKLSLRNKVIITNFVSLKDLKNLYANCEFFVYPSFYEGFGIPVIEAVKSNKLVLLSNTSSMSELLPQEHEFYFNPYNIDEISVKIDLAYSIDKSKKDKIIKRSRNFIKKFSWDICAIDTIAIIKNYEKAL